MNDRTSPLLEPMSMAEIDELSRPSFRLVGELTAAQYDRAMEIVAEPLTITDGDFRIIAPPLLEHARWVLDRIDSGMLNVAEDETE